MINSQPKRIKLGYPLDLLLNRECKFEKYDRFINNNFDDVPETIDIPGSITLPEGNDPGTGNIIIRGKPGTAKSTLALQLAVTAAQKNNDCISFYLTLEERPENIFYKSKLFGWDYNCRIFNQLCGLDEPASIKDFQNYLKKALTQNKEDCKYKFKDCNGHGQMEDIVPMVYISTLSPRNLFVSGEKEFDLFWDRYEQLERLLISAHAYNNELKDKSKNKISFVCIDSINVFGDNLLSRSELFRIFDLFKRYEIIGIIIVEEDEKSIFNSNDKLHGETIEYIGDLIISLTSENDQNYALRYLEITKSRYQHQVYGKHPFRISESKKISSEINDKLIIYESIDLPVDLVSFKTKIDESRFKVNLNNIRLKPSYDSLINFIENTSNFPPEKIVNYKYVIFKYKNPADIKDGISVKIAPRADSENEESIKEINCELILELPLKPVFAVKVFPSLHYIVYGTEVKTTERDLNSEKEREVFCDDYANFFLSKEHKKNSSILIEGPRDTFKTSLARDFIIRGLYKDDPISHVIFIKFQDYYLEAKTLQKFRISKAGNEKVGIDDWENFIHDVSEKSTKIYLNSYINTEHEKEKRFTELIYQSGYISPEEFVQILLETIFKFYHPEQKVPEQKVPKLNRIVIDEIGRIGSSYPLLFNSKTAGELFLTAVSHIIRNYNIKLLITGSTKEYSKADEIINKAKTLVDEILSTKKINVFGDNYVTIQGGTLTSSDSTENEHEKSGENVPGVIIPSDINSFKVDKDKFIGLVGFDTNIIYRPGIDLYFNEENEIHTEYNQEVKLLLKYAFGQNLEMENPESENIHLSPLFREKTSVILDSLGILQDKPIKNTVIVALDEFFLPDKNKDSVVLLEKPDSYTLPYYNNVLLFAVNNSVLKGPELMELRKNMKWGSWKEIEDAIIKAKFVKDRKFKLIDFCSEISETQSCIFLDIISSTYSKVIPSNPDKEKDDFFDNIFLEFEKPDYPLRNELINNFLAFKNVIECSPKIIELVGLSNFDEDELKKCYSDDTIEKLKMSKNTDIHNIVGRSLVPDSLFYICWYSELRHLIHNNPELASEIEVYPLPGKGFQGDWNLGILKGSVSEKLGRDVLKLLCDDKEDFKRFVRGVGLPTQRFNKGNNFLAWPGSKKDISLENIFTIHKDAKKRSDIYGYLNLRLAFGALLRELIMIKNDKEISDIIVDRLPLILKRLKEGLKTKE